MQERWDVVLRVLDGPMSAMGEQTLRGPVIRIGSNPGPGGFKLNGYRGLDHRHAVITAYDKATASIAPVGTAQVRMAPHPNVRWQDIDPMSGPNYLSQGCAIHLGPVGRGCTLEFVRIQKLGVWQQGELLSAHEAPVDEVARAGDGVVQADDAPPAAYQARRVTRIRSSTVPIWFAGGLLVMAAVALSCIGVFLVVRPNDIEPLGPEIEGEQFYPYTSIPTEQIDARLKEGLRAPFHDFVMEPSGIVADPDVRRRVVDPETWDQVFYDRVAASVQTHIAAFRVFRRLDEIKDDYAYVVEEMRDAGLPDVFAAIPYLESRYQPQLQSKACAKGYWQFMPEVAHRLTTRHGIEMVVRDCRFVDAPEARWTPERLTPPAQVYRTAIYIDRRDPENPSCRIPENRGCAIDQRTELAASTRGAVFTLSQAYNDPELRKSGAVVAATIASHNAGYDDSRFGVRKRSNVLPAFRRWASAVPRERWHTFYGANVTTTSPDEGWNGSVLPPETQHYVYTIVAEHLLAVCYYAQNYGDEEAFRPWVRYTRGDGYCKELDIPSRDEVRR